jgi:hypothetical protein
MNLGSVPREDCVIVDSNLHKAGGKMTDMLDHEKEYLIEQSGSAMFVRIPLEPYSIAILKEKIG